MHHHNHLTSLLHNKELNELYISTAIRSFALSLIVIFLPIYLLQEGFSLTQVLIFFAILSSVHALAVIPTTKVACRYGFKHAIFFSIPFLIVAYLMLYTIDIFGWPLWIIAVLMGLQNSLFWMGYHVDFAKFSNKKKRSSEVGMAKITTSVFHVAGPVVGGFVLVLVGFKILFIFVSGLLIFSIVPLFFSKDIHSPIKISWKGAFENRKLKSALGFAGFGMERRALMIIWPIFIFFSILGESYTSLGSVASLGLFSSLIFVFIIGKFSDKYKKLVLKLGAILNMGIWVLKAFVTTVSQVFIVDTIQGGTQTMINVPFDAVSYDRANNSQSIVKYIAFREIMINAGATVFLIAMVFVSNIVAGFLFGGGIGSLLLLLF